MRNWGEKEKMEKVWRLKEWKGNSDGKGIPGRWAESYSLRKGDKGNPGIGGPSIEKKMPEKSRFFLVFVRAQ